LECEDLFILVGITEEQRVCWGLAHVRGQAKTWLSTAGLDLKKITWPELCQVLIEIFPDNQNVDPMDQLQHLKQVGTVDSYINAYESWMTLMKRGRSYLPQEFFIDRFLSGLKDNIKHTVQCQKPTTLLSAYWFARQYEKSCNSNMQVPRRNPVAAPAYQQPARNAAVRDIRNRVPNDRPREPRKCWYCPDNWVVGHRCQPMQRALNALQMQGNSDEDEEPDNQPVEEAQPVEQLDNLMHISSA
jgi:hypothetical protein